MRSAMGIGHTGIRYLLGGSNYRLSEWLHLIGEQIGRPPPQYRVPYTLALVAAYCSEFWADHVTHSMPMATVTGVRLTRRSMHFDPSPTAAELGFKTRDIKVSALDAVAWYRDQGWI
jgi:dihydroflavonol-4-reductase